MDRIEEIIRRWKEEGEAELPCIGILVAEIERLGKGLDAFTIDSMEKATKILQLKAELVRKDEDLKLNAKMLARQCDLAREAEAELARQSELLKDWKEVDADHKRLVRELDELLNGKEGMARQASLCDLVAQVTLIKKIAGQ